MLASVNDGGVQGGAPALALGDFNGDHFEDLVLGVSGGVAIALGDGTGRWSLSDAGILWVGYTPWTLAVGDFNGDGVPDVVAGDVQGRVVSILLGNGDGTLRVSVDYPSSTGCYGLFPGDFNNDGNLDLALLCASSTSVLLGQGDGSFKSPLVSPAPSCAPAIPAAWGTAVADFNGDGNLDIAHSCPGAPVSLSAGRGDGTLAAGVPIFDVTADAIAAVDLNQDGLMDLVVASNFAEARTGSLIALLNRGDGGFIEGEVRQGPAWEDMAIAPFDSDGSPEIALIAESPSVVELLRPPGDGGLGAAWMFVTTNTVNQAQGTLLSGDVNGDGRPESHSGDQ